MKREEFSTAAKNNRRVTVLNDCTGSPNCVAEMRIEDMETHGWQEAHLNYEECKRIRAALKIAMREWKAENDNDHGDTELRYPGLPS